MIKRAKTKIGKTKQQSAIINVATKRLMKDWMEIVKNPLKGINAAPISEKNLFVWHCNLRGYGPYEGGIFHLVFNFPQEYPNKPPSITMCTRIEHPNVIGSTICLDMLQEGSSDKYTGWTSAYTVQSILVQLQAFLFEADVSRVLANIQDPKTYEQKKKEWLSAVKWSVEQSRIYSDKTVGHYPPHKLFPQFPEDAEETKHLFINENIEKTAEEIENLTTKSELVCFFTRGSFEEDVLGYGISYSKNLRTGAIKSIQTPLDLISLRAFMNHGLRSSSYNEKFTHWIPIFIDDKHGQKAMHLAKRSISIICTGSAKNFHPDQVLEVLPKLMSTMTVEVMAQRKHASIKSLRGYCHFYRLLLEFIKEYPILLEKINQNVKSFIESEEYRHKDQMPNLGEFLAIVPASDYSWNDIRDAYIQESFTRNVFWLLNKYEELEMENSDEFNDEDRLKYSFETTKVSQKLLIFNVFFIEKISKPNESKTREEVSKIFDEHLGRIPIKYEDLFIEMIEKINKVESYSDFFKLIQNDITIDDIVKLLKESVKKSKEKGYHGSNLSVLSPEEFAKQSKQVGLENFLVKIGNEMVLESNEEKWKERCFTRWGFNELPQYLINNLDNSWRKLYLQNNLQDVISNLNDSSDFNYFHQTLDYSIEIPRLEIQMFNPEKLKSKYYFLTCVLTKLKNLDTLVISRGEDGLGVKGFRALIKGLSNNPGKLQNLILDSCDINSQSIQELTKGRLVSSNLRRIVLNGNPIGEQGATYLGEFLRRHENLPHLTELDLSRCSIGEVGAKAIAEALLVKKELKLLNFVGNPANGGLSQLFQNLSYSTSVEQIDFSKSNSSYDSGDNSIGKLLDLSVSLKKLNLWKTTGLSNLSQTVFNKLSKSTLKELDMAETGFKNMKFFANALKDNLSLEDLNLMGNGITCSDLYSFYEELICLYNKANPQKKQSTNAKDSDDQSNQPPPQMINLKRIILSNNRMDSYPTNKNKFPRVIGEILKMSPRLVYLDLSKCLITREHMEGIGEALTSKYSLPLKTLLLKNNNLGKFGLKPLVAALQSNTTLEHLDISGNDIGVVGADYLSDIMKENKSIKTLNLFSCFIQIEGAELLSKALLNNTTLTNLDLGLNRIKVRGAMSIVKLLQVNTSLKRVGLKHNHINDKAGLALATAITQENPQSNVTYLALAGNYLTVAKRSDISLSLTSCKERNIEFDLAKLVEVKDPEKQDRTIYITPLPGTVTSQQVKRLFYQNRCGVILNVHILKHKSIESFSEQNYAFVEFAHPDSVQLAMRLQHQNKNVINNTKVRIAKAGIQGLQEDSNKNKPKSQVPKAPRAVVRGGRGGRGGARGGRGGARVPRRR